MKRRYAIVFVVWLAVAVTLPVSRAFGLVRLSWGWSVAPAIALLLLAGAVGFGWYRLNRSIGR